MERKSNQPEDGALIPLRAENAKKESATFDDGKAEEAAEILREMQDLMHLDADVEIRSDGEEIVLDIQGPDAGRIIGKKGQTLDAIQYIINKIVNQESEQRRHVVLDSGDYRERKEEGLVSLAQREASRAVNTGRVVTMRPMNARDRRIIHLSLSNYDGVTTESEGEGMQRRIQIIPSQRSRHD